MCSFWLNFNFTWIAVKCVGPVCTPPADCHLARPCNRSPLLALVSWMPQQRHCPVLNGSLSCSSMPRRKPFRMQSWRLKWVFPAWLGNLLNLADHLLVLAHIYVLPGNFVVVLKWDLPPEISPSAFCFGMAIWNDWKWKLSSTCITSCWHILMHRIHIFLSFQVESVVIWSWM